MLPVKRVIASAIRSCRLRLPSCSRRWSSKALMFRSTTWARSGELCRATFDMPNSYCNRNGKCVVRLTCREKLSGGGGGGGGLPPRGPQPRGQGGPMPGGIVPEELVGGGPEVTGV